MQLQDIIGEVRKILGEVEPSGYGSQQPGQGTWDNSQLIGYANECLGLLSHPIRLEGTQTITLSTSTNAYNIPSDCLEDGIRSLVYNATGSQGPVPCDPIELKEYEQLLLNPPNTGVLIYRYKYAVWAGQILFTPYPQNVGDTATLYYYKAIPSLVNATDVPLVPLRFHVAIVHYVTAMAQKAVEETGLYQLEMQSFEALEVQLRGEMSRKSRDRNRVRRK